MIQRILGLYNTSVIPEPFYNKAFSLCGVSHRSRICRICQALRWDVAVYEFAEVSEGFECDGRLQVGDAVIVGRGIAPAKQKAKAIAARQVMEKLKAIARCG